MLPLTYCNLAFSLSVFLLNMSFFSSAVSIDYRFITVFGANPFSLLLTDVLNSLFLVYLKFPIVFLDYKDSDSV